MDCLLHHEPPLQQVDVRMLYDYCMIYRVLKIIEGKSETAIERPNTFGTLLDPESTRLDDRILESNGEGTSGFEVKCVEAILAMTYV